MKATEEIAEKKDERPRKEAKKERPAWGLDSEGEGVQEVVIFERQPEEVGMTESLGVHRGFSGVVKNRWEDFHVHEIDLEGQVVRLTSTDLPADDLKEKVSRFFNNVHLYVYFKCCSVGFLPYSRIFILVQEKVDLSVLSEETREGLTGVADGELEKFTIPVRCADIYALSFSSYSCYSSRS